MAEHLLTGLCIVTAPLRASASGSSRNRKGGLLDVRYEPAVCEGLGQVSVFAAPNRNLSSRIAGHDGERGRIGNQKLNSR